MSIKYFQLPADLPLENGALLHRPTIAYNTYGKLNAKKDNVIWVCHALTANSDVFDWWKGLFGKEDLFNPDEYFIVCANMLSSHYGTTGPLSVNPKNGKQYFHDFPEVTIRDMVELHQYLARELKIDRINTIIGGSMGGQQALEWAVTYPDQIEHLVLIATNASHSAWGVAFNASQRMAIEQSSDWNERHENAGLSGMKTARSMALLSYRNYNTYVKTQTDDNRNLIFPEKAESYQRYQGEKLALRFNAFSYWYLSKAMDSHNVGRYRDGIQNALANVTAKSLVISIEDDVLFPPADQIEIAEGIKNAVYKEVPSIYGHDGFLIETEALSAIIKNFLFETEEDENSNQKGVALIGFGTVGQALYPLLEEQENVFVNGVSVKHPEKPRALALPFEFKDALDLIYNDRSEIILEAVDNAEDAYKFAKASLHLGKTYISANKKMLAHHLPELLNLEQKHGGKLLFEAAVGASIPVLHTLDSYLNNEEILSISGIINGSTNYILTEMEEQNLDYDSALKNAQDLGYAESDPSLDVEGYDPSFKAVLLAYKAFGVLLNPEDVYRKGIDSITADDILTAKNDGQRIKLLFNIKKENDSIKISVQPEKVNSDNAFYHVNGSLNAVLVEAKNSGEVFLKGHGAGGIYTASAMIANLNQVIQKENNSEKSLLVESFMDFGF